MALESLGICQAVELLGGGNVSATELIEDCLKRVDEYDPEIKAWAWLDQDHAKRQAQALDDVRRAGKPIGRLHGVPIGIKDIIDTALIPTEHGSEFFKGRLPKADAALVDRLKQQGAIIMGKTVTAGLATFMPGKTTNPHNHQHTPGGSSSGSAAAVASFMVPGAVGTQTNGSVIRPASFCGTVGYKPSYGLIPRHGVLRQSPFLDQVGVFARQVEDTALLAEVMMSHHPEDDATLPQLTPPPLHQICIQEPPLPPKFGFVKTPIWDRAENDTCEGFNELIQTLGAQVEEVELASSFAAVWDHLKTVNEAEMATWYRQIYQTGRQYLDEVVISQIERGMQTVVPDYINAMAHRTRANAIVDELFDQYDALITPAAPGEAPKGLDTTGDPAFCTPWTFCGIPAVSLPLLQGNNGLPIGVQLVGAYLDDGRLLRSARWLNQHLLGESV
ncbi:MAG: amidase [bacterium]